MNKKSLLERDICTKYITPAFENVGWDKMEQIMEEVTFTAGRVVVQGMLLRHRKARMIKRLLPHCRKN